MFGFFLWYRGNSRASAIGTSNVVSDEGSREDGSQVPEREAGELDINGRTI